MPDKTDVEKMEDINRILETMSSAYDDENRDHYLVGFYYDKDEDKIFFKCKEE